LRDKRQTDAALELQTAESELQQAQRQRDLATNLLLKSVDGNAEASSAAAGANPYSYTVVRNRDGGPVEQPASETMLLLPGDVLSVKRSAPAESERSSSAPSPASSQTVSQALP
jgi:hypothetical protein